MLSTATSFPRRLATSSASDTTPSEQTAAPSTAAQPAQGLFGADSFMSGAEDVLVKLLRDANTATVKANQIKDVVEKQQKALQLTQRELRSWQTLRG
jgi:hypothetical protein